MTQDRVRKRMIANAENMAAGFDRFQEELFALFETTRAKDLNTFTAAQERLETMVAALAQAVADSRIEAAHKREELLAGIAGLSQQLSEYEALVPPPERVRAIAMIADHEERLRDLEWGERDDGA